MSWTSRTVLPSAADVALAPPGIAQVIVRSSLVGDDADGFHALAAALPRLL